MRSKPKKLLATNHLATNNRQNHLNNIRKMRRTCERARKKMPRNSRRLSL
jgi:hypothetical protein